MSRAVTKEAEIRGQLREWVAHTSGKIALAELHDSTPLIAWRILSSAQVMDLILFLEELSSELIDVETLRPGVFRDIDTIYRCFFERRRHAA